MGVGPGFRAVGATLALLTLGGRAMAGPLPGGPPPVAPAEQPSAASPSLFERAFGRQEYLRQSRTLLRGTQIADQEAERARAAAAAAEARRKAWMPLPEPAPISPLPTAHSEHALEDRRRAARDANMAHQRTRQERLQRFLEAGRRADAAMVRSEIASARSARARQIVRGLDRLHAGAAAEWKSLGDRTAPGRGLLIRTPRVSMD